MELRGKYFIVVLAIGTLQANDVTARDANQTQTEFYNVTAEIEKLLKGNVVTIEEKSNKVEELLGAINSRNITLGTDLDAAIDGYFSPVVSLFNSTLKLFPSYKGDFSRGKFVLPEVKAEILNNITATFSGITGVNGTASVAKEVSTIIKKINEKVTDKYVDETCKQQVGFSNYNRCIKNVLTELGNEIQNADKLLDSLYNHSLRLDKSLNADITDILKTSLANVYNSTTLQIVNSFIGSLWSNLRAAYLASYIMEDRREEIYNFGEHAKNMYAKIEQRVKNSMNFANDLGIWIDYDRFTASLHALTEKMFREVESSFNVDIILGRFINSIDPSYIDSELKKCASRQNDFKQAINNCIKRIITDLNRELKVELSDINKYLNGIKNIYGQRVKNLEQYLNHYILKSRELIKKNTKSDDFLAIVELYEKYVLIDNNHISNNLEAVIYKTDFETSVYYGLPNGIGNALYKFTLASSMFHEDVLRGRETSYQELSSKAYDTRTSVVYQTLTQNGAYTYSNVLKNQIKNIDKELIGNKTEIKPTQITKKCIYKNGKQKVFVDCVENILKDYHKSVGTLSQKLDDIYNTALNFSSSIIPLVNATMFEDLKPVKIESDIIGDQILKRFNVTSKDVLKFALRYTRASDFIEIVERISPSLEYSAKVIDKNALEIKRQIVNNLTLSGSAVYDVVGIGWNLCDTKSADQLLNDTISTISIKTKELLSKSLDVSRVINSLINFAKFLNSHKSYQLSLLDEDRLNVLCRPSLGDNENLYDYYACLRVNTWNLDSYYYFEKDTSQKYLKSARDNEERSLKVLKKFELDIVTPQIKQIKQKAELNAANVYKQCKITVDQMLNYSISVARSHYDSFQTRISSNLTAVNDLIEVIAGKINSSINTRLQSAASAVYRAIEADLNSKNISLNYELIKNASESLINDNILDYDTFIKKYLNTRYYKHYAEDKVNYRKQQHESYNYSTLNKTCYYAIEGIVKSKANELDHYKSMVVLSACTNNLVYRNIYLEANMNVLNYLLKMKEELQNVVELMDDYAEKIIIQQKWSSYSLVSNIYGLAWSGIPDGIFN